MYNLYKLRRFPPTPILRLAPYSTANQAALPRYSRLSLAHRWNSGVWATPGRTADDVNFTDDNYEAHLYDSRPFHHRCRLIYCHLMLRQTTL